MYFKEFPVIEGMCWDEKRSELFCRMVDSYNNPNADNGFIRLYVYAGRFHTDIDKADFMGIYKRQVSKKIICKER